MIRKVALSMVAVVVLMGATAIQARAQFDPTDEFPEQVQKDLLESVVRISATDGTKSWQGSGVCVEYDGDKGVALILTAGHVVKDAKRISFEVFTRDSYPNAFKKYSPQAKWWYDEKEDIAIIAVKMWVPRKVRIAEDPKKIKKDAAVMSLGCGFGAPPCAQTGRIAGFDDESGDYLVERGAVGGRSGGPLISQDGVIGVVSRGRNGLTLFVSLDKIHSLVKRAAAEAQATK
jgi:S1-C subfamily serine protease